MSRAGFSLVEVIVAMVLLAIALLAIAGSGLMAARTLRHGEMRETAAARAAVIVDSLITYRLSGAGAQIYAGYRIEWNAAPAEVTARVVFNDGGQFSIGAAR